MSRKGSRKGLLLDTSFLLPVLGFRTGQRVMRVLPRLVRYELYYSELSLLEALWKIVKLLRAGGWKGLDRVLEGVRALATGMGRVSVDAKAVELALEMYRMGYRDMIDNLLYGTAVSSGLRLLTVDDELVEFVEKNGLPRDGLVTPEELEGEEGRG